MRVLVCGDRDWQDTKLVYQELRKLPAGTTIIEGEARGADTIARLMGTLLNFKVIGVKADWDGSGRAAGPIRNQIMLNMTPDLVIAFHDSLSSSKGTKDMVVRAMRKRVPVRLVKHQYAGSPGIIVGADVIDLHRAMPRWLSHLVGGRRASR